MNTKKIGIDKINFFTPTLYVDMIDLAHARDTDPNKYTIGIGQEKMGINPITQDAVSMGANAALPIISKEDALLIDMVIFATESGTDYSKSGAVSIHKLLGINPFARCIEMKQACYSATAGIMMAKDYVTLHPGRKVLVIGSDIARYGLNTPGEVTQGAGAVAMLIAEDPRIFSIRDETVMYTSDIFDFWRPTYSENAMVDGKFSNEAYINFFETVLKEYQSRYSLDVASLEALCFHLPYSKMGKKAMANLLENVSETTKERFLTHYEESIIYTKNIGNIYTGSLYLGLNSLLDNAPSLKAGHTIGCFSYGSGAVGEFFLLDLVDGFDEHLLTAEHTGLLAARQLLTVAEYEEVFSEKLPTDGSTASLSSRFDHAPIQLVEVTNHQRHYDFVGESKE
ncbi:hydroxymethylglutaryl-CoA synthase [Vagococcus xieshaowenii]|uniref:Hydroxymethylglutaryl-CoA synthase n=1 Tax=Vagococcus xieshaowenii TaxID=2562451 RepID=A0AAJ5EF94_9ENTE|nr:hydroxymethylglutaryl-CoA synthase [Vagococcus xieshaowenii]QCA28668.1 hydroxymethylglutaryl-CoA synthase [Vagococcus xieshaowenii]TFZ40524.1 hydroxymethylglutaryl-CoA synthase [Vagococcus xieshaowenii]